VNPAPTHVPPVIAGANSRRLGWIVAAVVLLIFGLAFFRAYHPFPSDEERQYFGWWYGWETFNDENHARAWVAEFRDDGTLHIKFGQYNRVNAEKDWQFSSSEEHGTWRVRQGVQHLVTEDPQRRASRAERIVRWLETGYAQRRHSYRTTLINDHELHYTSIEYGTEYRSRHSLTAVELPAQPAPPEQWPLKTMKN
jgi:hypothetical protein